MDHRQIVVVTGSSGFIGSAAIKRLAERYRLVGLDREGGAEPPSIAECVEGDLTSDESIAKGLRGVRERHGDRVASVIHLAAYYDFSGEPSPKYDEITVRCTEQLLRALRPFRVEQFVFSSTMLVHAPCQPGERTDEDSPLDPTCAYPKSKLTTEQLMRAARQEDKPLWRTFWVGGTMEGGAEDSRQPHFGPPSPEMAPAMVWGVGVPWTLVVSALIGFWLMGAPAVFDATAAASDFIGRPPRLRRRRDRNGRGRSSVAFPQYRVRSLVGDCAMGAWWCERRLDGERRDPRLGADRAERAARPGAGDIRGLGSVRQVVAALAA